ncbi:hypothetical protein GBAR_LOCUS20641 [Geodia barretti]|uniref:Uncharacterized protein n=1 Tax=Geodia barretti TaxID=519541 RepID=A0AA35SX30_GEOBA|nr:hypothetical protein GBAR_LOCUS20641 [Geodia barretti]
MLGSQSEKKQVLLAPRTVVEPFFSSFCLETSSDTTFHSSQKPHPLAEPPAEREPPQYLQQHQLKQYFHCYYH